jgi:hypothetical protein
VVEPVAFLNVIPGGQQWPSLSSATSMQGHTPPEHALPFGQTCPQAPQFWPSSWTFLQTPPPQFA